MTDQNLISVQGEAEVNVEGISNSFDWHQDRQVRFRKVLSHPGDRAILCQSERNRNSILCKFDGEALDAEILRGGSFGENLCISGEKMAAEFLCIGDIFDVVRNGKTVATFQVSNPRRPCYKVGSICFQFFI